MKKLLLMLIIGVMAISTSMMTADAAVLFSESWDSDQLSSNPNWTGGGALFLYDLGTASLGNSGDYALFLNGGYQYQVDAIFSSVSYPRGDNLSCTFKWFHNDCGLLYTSIQGPWAFTGAPPATTYPGLEMFEAGLARELSGDFHYCELTNGDGSLTESGPVDSTFNAALMAANHKDNAVTIRMTLGDSTGAHLEYSTDGVNFVTPNLFEGESFEAAANSIGMVADTNWLGSNYVSSTANVYVSFGGGTPGCAGGSAQGVVDDIVVETGGGVAPSSSMVEEWELSE